MSTNWTEFKNTLDQIGDAAEENYTRTKEQLDRLDAKIDDTTQRLETVEAGRNATNRLGANRAAAPAYQVLHLGDERAYLVRGSARLSDIPELRARSAASGMTLGRWFNAVAFGDASEDREAIQFASENTKATTGSTTGLQLPEIFVPEWFDLARAASVHSAAGGTTILMAERTVSFTAITADPSAAWRSSEGQSLTASDPTFALRSLVAKSLASRTQVSLEAGQDVPQLGEQLMGAHAKAHGAAIDRAVLRGSGSGGEPTGINGTSGRSTVTSVGSVADWDKVLDGVELFLASNNELAQLTGLVWHPLVWKKYAKLKSGLSGDKTSLTVPPSLQGVPKFVTTSQFYSASPEGSTVTMGNFADAILGLRMRPSVRILDGTASMAANLLLEVVAVSRADVAIARPASFVSLEGYTGL